MSDGFSYIVEMVDRISGPSKTAEQEIVAMTSKLTSQSAALDAMQREFKDLESVLALDPAMRAKAVDMIAKQETALTKTTSAIRKSVDAERDGAAKLVADEKKKNEAIANEQTKATESAKKAMTDQIASAKNTIDIGRETITAAFGAIAGAARALGQGDVRGAVTGLADSVASMAKLLDVVVPGLGQAVAAVISIAGGMAGILVGLAQSGVAFTLESVGAKNAMLAMFDAMGGGNATGAQTEEMIDRVKASTGFLKDELISYTKSLMAMGETDLGQIEGSIKAMSASSAMMGQEGVGAFTALKAKIQEATAAGVGLKLADKQLSKLYATGANVDDVAKKMGISTKALRDQLTAGSVNAEKFGLALEDALIEKGQGPLDIMTSQLPYLKKMLAESIGDMFEDIKKPAGEFLAEVKKLFAIFSQASPTGQALKAGIGAVFGTILEHLTAAVPMVRVFFKQLMIYALEAYIAVKPLVSAIQNFGGAAKDGPGVLTVIMRTVLETIEKVGAAIKPTVQHLAAFISSAEGARTITAILGGVWSVIKSVAIAVVAVVAVFATLWVAATVVGVTLWAIIGAAIGFAMALTQDVANAITSVITFFDNLGGVIVSWVNSAPQAAVDFVAGLVNGITGGAANVVSAVSGLADGAIGAFKNVLGIHSPSAVMHDLGEHGVDAGLAGGVDAGAPDVEGAMTNVAAAPVAGAQAGIRATGPAPAAGASSSSSAASITLAPGAIVITAGGASAAELLDMLTSQLADKLEELMMQLGGAKA